MQQEISRLQLRFRFDSAADFNVTLFVQEPDCVMTNHILSLSNYVSPALGVTNANLPSTPYPILCSVRTYEDLGMKPYLEQKLPALQLSSSQDYLDKVTVNFANLAPGTLYNLHPLGWERDRPWAWTTIALNSVTNLPNFPQASTVEDRDFTASEVITKVWALCDDGRKDLLYSNTIYHPNTNANLLAASPVSVGVYNWALTCYGGSVPSPGEFLRGNFQFTVEIRLASKFGAVEWVGTNLNRNDALLSLDGDQAGVVETQVHYKILSHEYLKRRELNLLSVADQADQVLSQTAFVGFQMTSQLVEIDGIVFLK